MQTTRLDGAWWKFQRAIDQAKDLSGYIKSYLDALTHDLSYEAELKTRDHIVRFILADQPAAIRAVPLGKIVHDLRSALEHAVWQLVIDNGKRPRSSTGFPIFASEIDYLEGNARNPPGINRLRGVPDEARTLITSIQPYQELALGNDPRLTTLYVLNQLWNIDKHRTLNLMALGMRGTSLRVSATGPINIVAKYDGKRLKDGTEIVRYRVPPSAPQSGRVKVEMGVAGRVVIDEVEGGLAEPLSYDDLAEIAVDVRDILKLLSQFAKDRPQRA